MQKKEIVKAKNRLQLLLAFTCFFICIFIFGKSFFPALREEVRYELNSKKNIEDFNPTPVDVKFSILIPKLWINSRVIPNVNPENPSIYQKALSLGVAQALGSALPDQDGNVFLFAHSAVNWYEAKDYNAVFYILYKLEVGDDIQLVYGGKKYDYEVFTKKYVDSTEVRYMEKKSDLVNGHTLTLMTCWPPGTSIKRLVVEARAK